MTLNVHYSDNSPLWYCCLTIIRCFSILFQASAAGLTPPAAPAVDMSGDKLLAEQLVLQLVKTQETGALARGAAATSNTNTDQQMDRMDGALKDQMVSGSGM